MCGRFAQAATPAALAELAAALDVTLGDAVHRAPPPRYNLAPTQPCLSFVRAKEPPLRRASLLAFGMARHPTGLVLNARSETVTERPMFRDLLGWHRCLVVASGFYEWQPAQPGGRKTPYYFRRADGAPFCFAALRGRDRQPGIVLLTCAANDVVGPVHARMPVMLTPEDARTWLAWETPVPEGLALLRPYAGAMVAHPVGTQVNRPSYDAADCIAPLPAAAGR